MSTITLGRLGSNPKLHARNREEDVKKRTHAEFGVRVLECIAWATPWIGITAGFALGGVGLLGA